MSEGKSTQAEPPLYPDLPIVDAHHHFWGEGHGGAKVFGRFLPEDFSAQIAESGHRVAGTVYVDCGWAFRETGPEALRCVGETEYVEAVANRAAIERGPAGKLGAGIVARADLLLGEKVRDVLEAHIAAAPARFRGIRELLAYDPDAYRALNIVPGKSRDPRFRAGFRQLGLLGLSADILCVHTMLDEIIDLARAFPETPIILNHLAGPIGIGRFRGRRADVFADWRGKITELARLPNVAMKLGGFGADVMGFDWNEAAAPPDSIQIANVFRAYIAAAIDAFGPSRCLFGSNFPVDRQSFAYGTMWNAYKRVAADYTIEEQKDLLHCTAQRLYRLSL